MTTHAETEIARLRAELDRLRTENDALRATPSSPEPPAVAVHTTRGRQRWRAWVSALCIVLAAVLVPLSVVGSWTRAQLVDEQKFVATFSPLAQSPDVQALVIERASAAVDDAVNIDGLTNDLFDGIAALDLPPAAQKALGLLRGPAAAGARSAVTSAITQVVQSGAFTAVWDKSLVATHRALVAAATGSDSDALAISGNGELTVQLGPIIDELKTVLTQQGFGFVSAVPSVNVSIVIGQADALALIAPIYAVAATVGYLLPFVALALFGIGVLVARRRSTAALGIGIGIAVAAGVLAIAFTVGGVVLSLQAPSLGVPASTLQNVYDIITGRMHDISVVLIVVGIAVGLGAWLGGRWTAARRVRAVSSSLVTSARRGLQARGMSTGAFGEWLYRQRLLVRLALLALAIVVLVFAGPLSLGLVLGTVAVTLVLWLVLELLSRHPDDPLPAEPPALSEDQVVENELVEGEPVDEQSR